MTLRLANVRGRAALVDPQGTRFVDLHDVSGGRFPTDPMDVFPIWDDLRGMASTLSDFSSGSPLRPEDLGAPSPRPRQIFGIGLNYRSHAEESGLPIPSSPLTFTKFPSSVTGPNDPITIGGDKVDWEVEMVVVMAGGGRNITSADAWDRVAGICVGQDISDRALQFATQPPQFNLGKSRAGFSPFGPWLVDASHLANRDRLHLSMTINGEQVQDTFTDDLIFDVPAIVAYLSTIVELLPGDVIYTGTPGGVGMSFKPPRFLRAGDVIVSHLDGVGSMTNHCR